MHNLKKLKLGIKDGTEVTLNLSSNSTGNSNDEPNCHKLLLTNTQVSRLLKSSENDLSANINSSKPTLFKIV